jgi:hypothetical protein
MYFCDRRLARLYCTGIVRFRGVCIRLIDDGPTEIGLKIRPDNQPVVEASGSVCEFVIHRDTLRPDLPEAVEKLR